MKKEEKTSLTRERILEAAMRAFAESGYNGVSLNALLAENKISKGLLYHNFSGKEALYLECVRRCFDDMTAFFESRPLRRELSEYLELRVRYFSEHPERAPVFFEAVLRPPEGMENKIRPLRAGLDAFNRRVYRETLKTLKLRPGVSEEQAVAYFELVQQAFNGYYGSPACADKTLGEMIEDHEGKLKGLVEFVLYGIAERRE